MEEERRLAFVGITRAKEELQLTYAVTRDFRGQRRQTIPSSFLMEMPREELELVDEATAFIAQRELEKESAWRDEGLEEDWVTGVEQSEPPAEHWQIDDVSVESVSDEGPSFQVAAAAITTAAALVREPSEARVVERTFRPTCSSKG